MNEVLIEGIKSEYGLDKIRLVQSKRGVHVYYVERDNNSYYLKSFDHESDALEINCYKVLSEHKLPIIKCYKSTAKSVLLEDITSSNQYRLGCQDDFLNHKVAKSVAVWFRQLHNIRKVEEFFSFLPEERIIFDREDLNKCLNYYKKDFFTQLICEIDTLNDYLESRPLKLIHDDFYYKNFFVNKVSHETIMFDFNFMKRGLVSQDLSLIRRNLSSASNDSEKAFIESYGDFDPLEYDVYELYRNLSCLLDGLAYKENPEWVDKALFKLNNNILLESLKLIMNTLREV